MQQLLNEKRINILVLGLGNWKNQRNLTVKICCRFDIRNMSKFIEKEDPWILVFYYVETELSFLKTQKIMKGV